MSSDLPEETRVSRRRLLQQGATLLGGVTVAGGLGGGVARAAIAAEPKKPAQLIIRTWGPPWSTGLQKAVAAKFSKQTGIKIKYDLTDFGPVQTKIQQALASGQRPPVDIVHTVGFFAERARVQKLTTPLDPKIVTHLRELVALGRSAGGDDDYVNLYSYTFPVIYNKTKLTPRKNMSWLDLWDSKYKGTFYAASTFEVLTFPLAKILGVDVNKANMSPVWKKMKQLKPSLAGFGQDPDFVTAMKSGQAKWGAFIVGNAFALRDAKVPIGWTVPKEGSSLTVDSMYVARGLPSNVAYWAQKFINAVLDASNLTHWTAIEGVVPTNRKSTPAPSMKGDPAFPFTEKEIAKYAIPFSLATAARNQDQWQAAYAAALQ
jgi:putative spermidine/putrescine transport system substrate-binding protein